jgi:hypothetical protein
MSRSHRHMPISGNTKAKSDKADKQKANRKLRVAMRGAVARGDEALPTLRQVFTENTFAKDGKRWRDPEKYPDTLRK